MLKSFVLFLSVLALPAVACDDEPPSLALRDAIYAGQIDTVERMLDAHQEQFEAGERSAKETWCLYRHFTMQRPDTFEFVEDWVEAYPNSPYARTARAWGNYIVSWQVRGDLPARHTPSGAMRAFSKLQARAWDDAEFAYAARPRLTAASNALISLANAARQPDRRRKVLDAVMKQDPNLGTLQMAVSHIIPGWGGMFREV